MGEEAKKSPFLQRSPQIFFFFFRPLCSHSRALRSKTNNSHKKHVCGQSMNMLPCYFEFSFLWIFFSLNFCLIMLTDCEMSLSQNFCHSEISLQTRKLPLILILIRIRFSNLLQNLMEILRKFRENKERDSTKFIWISTVHVWTCI